MLIRLFVEKLMFLKKKIIINNNKIEINYNKCTTKDDLIFLLFVREIYDQTSTYKIVLNSN